MWSTASALLLVLLAAGASPAAALHEEPVAAEQPEAAPVSAMNASSSAIDKVTVLLTDMKTTVEKEAKEDEEAFDKHACWCKTNDKLKTEAIEKANAEIADLTAFVEKAAGKMAELKEEIAGLEQDIAADKEALETAASIREKEHEQFVAEEADMKETITLLIQAIDVLSKVQLLQKNSGVATPEALKAEKTALVQVRDLVRRVAAPKFQNVLQRDFFDVLGSLEEVTRKAGGGFLRQHSAGTVLAQRRLLPWEKSEEQMGMESKPNNLTGAAAGAKSYNSRSGQIFGILTEMKDQFVRDLENAQKEEAQAMKDFEELKEAKLQEIAAAEQQKKQSEAQLFQLNAKTAQAKKNIANLEKAVDADETFLANMRTECQKEAEEYDARVKVRSEEIRALGEALTILTEDDARSLFDKTISFMQISDTSSSTAALEHKKMRVFNRLMQVAKKNNNWSLVSVALRVKLDSFTKVKEMMDKMLAELETQQKEEYEKRDLCNKEIDQYEDEIKVTNQLKDDLDEKHLSLENTIAQLEAEIKELREDVANMETSLKDAGEDRKTENQLYQTEMDDQRATLNILQKVVTRLKAFYTPNAGKKTAKLLQLHQPEENIPGRAFGEKPETKEYRKSEGAGSVLQLLDMIINDAEQEEVELKIAEQKAQEDYAAFVRDATASIEADREAIAAKAEQKAEAEAEKAETEEAQLAADEQLAKLTDLLKATHLECDYLLKYFDIRQQARAEEMQAIKDAKAILSGANYGKEEAAETREEQ